MELDLYFVREKVLDKSFMVCHIPSLEQITDVLTKPLTGHFFAKLRNKLKVVPSAALELRGNVKE